MCHLNLSPIKGIEKMRSVAGLSHLSQFWDKRPKKRSTLESFAVALQEGDRIISSDLKGGFHNLPIHPSLRKYFVVQFWERCFRYIAVPFGWCHIGYWFESITSLVWRMPRAKYRYRILDYIDNVLVCPRGADRVHVIHCSTATKNIRNFCHNTV